ncbi:hypothetical protein ACH5RR_006856 [Cinchona calisaya]|uniref:Transposase n=1 Tax=Cinchona calisaya TaxID=153742 RepID=A0ABD3AQ89_9GENT
MFLYVLAHNYKNRTVNFNFIRSGETVSRYFSIVLRVVIQLGRHYLIQPETEMEGYEDEKWEWFQEYLGALDGTHVNIHVLKDQGRYRNRKNEIATNVLGACSRDVKFTYILPGWEGSLADSKVLRDALVRQDPLFPMVSKYFLVDASYTNGPSFLAPYRGVRNVNERTFGLFKKRWTILRDSSFFYVKTHVEIINACAILHNLIRVEQPNDSYLAEVDVELGKAQLEVVNHEDEIDDGDEIEDENKE